MKPLLRLGGNLARQPYAALLPHHFQRLITEQRGIEYLADEFVQVQTIEQRGYGVGHFGRHAVIIEPPVHAGHGGFAAAHMACDHGVGQQLAVDGNVSAELFEYGVGVG